MQDYVNGYVQSVYSDSAWAQPIYSVSDVIVKKMETVSAEAARNGASVEIIGVKKLVDESVYEQMKALPIGEQMLVALAISGFGSEVQAAMTDMSVSYSQETALLIERILASLSMLTPEQLADRAEFIAQYFPRTQAYFSGVMRDYVTIDLLVEEDGIAYTERYGFCYDEYKGQWFFVRKTESDAPIM